MKGKEILTQFIRKHIWEYVFGTVVLIVSSVIASLIPKLLGIITDGLNRRNMSSSQIMQYVLIMLGVAAAVFVLKFIWRYFLIGNCRNVECYLRDRLFKHLQTLSVSFYNNHKTGDLVAYAINDIQAIRMVFGFGIVAILEGVVINSVSIFIMVKTINPILTLIALGPIPLIVVILVKLRLEIRDRFGKVQKAFAEISEKVQENISGVRVVKAFAQETEEVEDFITYSRKRVDTHMHLIKASAMLGPATQVCFGVSFLLFIIYGSQLVVNGTISLGDYVAFNTYIMAIMGPITNIARIIEVWQKGVASFRRLDEIFSYPSHIQDTEFEKVDNIEGEVVIKNLNFSYPGASKRALKNINIHVEKGKTLGILGKTGSGKTTLVNLLLRLYDVGDGHILVDGKDINSIPVDVLRENIGYVPQDNFLFSTTIKNNIEFFRHDHTEDEVMEATRMAGVYDNIVSFPNGFDTVVGERGVTLSGGQKQRISIARAIIKSPSILILDDSLSAVDTKTEEIILNNIKTILKDRTGIIISHRVSSVKHADEIVFMDKGKIVERGTHEELMELKGLYYDLYRIQMDQNEVGEEVAV